MKRKKPYIVALSEFIMTAAIENNELAFRYLAQQQRSAVRVAIAYIGRQLFPDTIGTNGKIHAGESLEAIDMEHLVIARLEQYHIEY